MAKIGPNRNLSCYKASGLRLTLVMMP